MKRGWRASREPTSVEMQGLPVRVRRARKRLRVGSQTYPNLERGGRVRIHGNAIRIERQAIQRNGGDATCDVVGVGDDDMDALLPRSESTPRTAPSPAECTDRYEDRRPLYEDRGSLPFPVATSRRRTPCTRSTLHDRPRVDNYRRPQRVHKARRDSARSLRWFARAEPD